MSASNRELGRIAAALGHDQIAIVESGHGNTWSAVCCCGWHSGRNYALVAPAISEAQGHIRAVVKEAKRDGVSLPRSVGAAL